MDERARRLEASEQARREQRRRDEEEAALPRTNPNPSPSPSPNPNPNPKPKPNQAALPRNRRLSASSFGGGVPYASQRDRDRRTSQSSA